MKIALLGPIGSGKTSIGNAILNRSGGVRVSFAAGLKREIAVALLAIDAAYDEHIPDGAYVTVADGKSVESYVRDMTDPATKAPYRSILQVWGTEFRRGQDPDYWVKVATRQIAAVSEDDPDASIVIDDCRFPNEYEALRRLGFFFVRLPANPAFPSDPTRDAHESEQHWPTFDVHYTVAEFVPGVDAVAEEIIAAAERAQ